MSVVAEKEDILNRLLDLREQVIPKSTASGTVEDAMVEIAKLRRLLKLKPGEEQM